MDSEITGKLSPEIEGVLTEIENIRGKTTIVEGKNDRKSLEKLGFVNIIELDKPLFKIVEDFPGREVVILTDLDKEGKRLYGKLYREFCRRGVKIDNKIRELLFKTKIRQIEGLARYLKREGV